MERRSPDTLDKIRALGFKLHKELEEYMRNMEKVVTFTTYVSPKHVKTNMSGLESWLPVEHQGSIVRPNGDRDFFIEGHIRAIYRMSQGGLRYPQKKGQSIKWKLIKTLTGEQLHARIVSVAEYLEQGRLSEEDAEMLIHALNADAYRRLK